MAVDMGSGWVHPLAQPTPYFVGKDKTRRELKWCLPDHRAQDRSLVARP